MIEGVVDVLEIDALPPDQGDRFTERTGFAPPLRHALPRDGRWLD